MPFNEGGYVGKARITTLMLCCVFYGLATSLTVAAKEQVLQKHVFSVSKPMYWLKRSDVVVPQGTPMGQYSRTIRPFPNWTLICDEDMSKHHKVCNITQNIVNKEGDTVFSWSVAGSEAGWPFFLLRLMSPSRVEATILLDPLDGGMPIVAAVSDCSDKLCLAFVSINKRLRQRIEDGGDIKLTYYGKNGEKPQTLILPLKGIRMALKGI